MFFLLRLRHQGAESLRVFERRPLIAKARVGDFVVRDDVNFSELTLCQIEFHEKQRRLVSQKKTRLAVQTLCGVATLTRSRPSDFD